MTIKKAEKAITALELFVKNNLNEFDNMIKELSEKSYVTNIDTDYFSAEVAEYWKPYCRDHVHQYMQEAGYENCNIMAYAKYYGESTPGGKYGACSDRMYILYDTKIWGSDEDVSRKRAEEFLDSEFDRWLKDNPNAGFFIE